MATQAVRYRSPHSLWGLPLVSIASGPDPNRGETLGHAKGIVAIGDIATGVVAVGGLSQGVIAVGGGAIGVLSFGGASVGILFAIGGLSIGAIAFGGLAIGLIALGGGAIGLVAAGGGAIGYYAVGGGAFGIHVIDGAHRDPEAVRFFEQFGPQVFPNGAVVAPPKNQPPNQNANVVLFSIVPSVVFWSVVQAVLQFSGAGRRNYKTIGIFAVIGGLILTVAAAITFVNEEDFLTWGSLFGIGLITLLHASSLLIRFALMKETSGSFEPPKIQDEECFKIEG